MVISQISSLRMQELSSCETEKQECSERWFMWFFGKKSSLRISKRSCRVSENSIRNRRMVLSCEKRRTTSISETRAKNYKNNHRTIDELEYFNFFCCKSGYSNTQPVIKESQAFCIDNFWEDSSYRILQLLFNSWQVSSSFEERNFFKRKRLRKSFWYLFCDIHTGPKSSSRLAIQSR